MSKLRPQLEGSTGSLQTSEVKLSTLGQYSDGRPPGNTQCCSFLLIRLNCTFLTSFAHKTKVILFAHRLPLSYTLEKRSNITSGLTILHRGLIYPLSMKLFPMIGIWLMQTRTRSFGAASVKICADCCQRCSMSQSARVVGDFAGNRRAVVLCEFFPALKFPAKWSRRRVHCPWTSRGLTGDLDEQSARGCAGEL